MKVQEIPKVSVNFAQYQKNENIKKEIPAPPRHKKSKKQFARIQQQING